MKSGDTHARRLTLLHGLIILAFAAIMLRGFGIAWDRWISKADDATTRQGDCVYLVFQGERCMGTVFFDGPRDLATIVKKAGAQGVVRAPEHATIPCSRVVRLLEHPPGYSLEVMSGSHLLCAGQRININIAGEKALMAVPWIGPRLAEKIVRYRLHHGWFGSLDDLQRVRGIGRRQLNRIRPFLQVGSTGVMAPVSALRDQPAYP
ncbi:MAG: helix-hairpin-helix domain-containing protein [Deltaproteobacteria bacterium]